MLSFVVAILTLLGCSWVCLLWYRLSSRGLDTHLERALLLKQCPCGEQHDAGRCGVTPTPR